LPHLLPLYLVMRFSTASLTAMGRSANEKKEKEQKEQRGVIILRKATAQ